MTNEDIKDQMTRTRIELLNLGDLLTDYPDKQVEAYGAAEMLEDWEERLK